MNTETQKLDTLANTYPSHVAWVYCDETVRMTLTLNSLYLTRDQNVFPLKARIRIYDQAQLIATHYSPEIHHMDSLILNINEVVSSRKVHHGYAEITVFSLNQNGLEHSYFGEMWASVFTDDGSIAINYPPLNFFGVDTQVLDADYLYYPGVCVDQNTSMNLVMLNQYDVPNHYDLTLYDASGKNRLQKRIGLAPKSASVLSLEEIFPNLLDFYKDGPGLLVTHLLYKMNGYIQTVHRPTQNLCGMDHLGYMAIYDTDSVGKLIDPKLANSQRLNDRLVCFCKSIPESYISGLQASGLDFEQIRKNCGAGTVCKGCVVELKKLLGDSV